MAYIFRFIQSLLAGCERFQRSFASKVRIIYFTACGVKISGNIYLGTISLPRYPSSIKLDPGVALDDGVILLASDYRGDLLIEIGSNTYINRNSFIDASYSILIGSDCMIGPGCYITDHDHTISSCLPPSAGPLIGSPTVIQDRVWLGANCVILKGVTIGCGSVIGAGSVVTSDVPPFSVYAGVPARYLKSIQ